MLEGYSRDEFGVIHQLDPQPIDYDAEYFEYYEGLKERTIRLGFLRLGHLVGLLGEIPGQILEIGYGPGSFIDAAQRYGVKRCFGSDLKPFPLPDGVDFVALDQVGDFNWQVIAMFDVLEHIPDLNYLDQFNCDYLYLAVPICQWNRIMAEEGEAAADQWLKNWRMLLPNEHIHHFDNDSLCAWMDDQGFDCLHTIVLEDGLRLRAGETGPNILTALFKKRK